MSNRIRGFVAALAASAVLLGGVLPAAAFEDPGLMAAEKETPVLLDAMVLRPLGLVLTAAGAAVFVVPAAFTLMTRRTDIGKPFHTLVAQPFRYTFLDPLGQH